MRIQSLLNPFDCGDHHGYRSSESPTPPAVPRSIAPYTSAPKRPKIPKDAAIFTDAKVNGPVNFPPHDTGEDEELAAQHRRFQLYPMGNILQRGARRIPYNSEKKDFMEKTGRDAFEVFQYEFKVPGDDKPYYVLWDYQIGLVRITPFFKCCKYSKTTPAKVLGLNPGLKDISYSITGGALAAQGYWMPYKAAKAVAATFCFNIRQALTPIFGKEFLSMCAQPKDPSYAKFLIDPAIVRECTEETNRWRLEGRAYKPPVVEQSSVVLLPPVPSTPSTPHAHFVCPSWGSKGSKTQRPKTIDQESGYGTDEDPSDKFLFSPEVSPRSQTWTPVNRSQSPTSLPAFSPPQRWLTSVPGNLKEEQLRTKRTLSKVAYGDDEGDDHPQTAACTTDMDTDSEVDGDEGDYSKKELDAAEILLNLRAADSVFHRTKRTRRGSKCC